MSRILIKGPAKTDYEVVIEQSFDNLGDELTKVGCNKKKVCIISDNNVWPIYKDTISDVFNNTDCVINTIILDSKNNSIENTESVCKELFEKLYSRNDYIIALGGGSVCDYAGFIASSFKRGMQLIYIPTSLMAMADCSVGGKVGIDFMDYKNMIGAYYNPKMVYINISCINTLEDIHYYSGFAEIMKASIIKSSSVYEWLIENLYEICDKDTNIISDMIEQTINIKKIYIEKDPYNLNDSMVLDLGHTVGHAIEKDSDYTMTHGECVALGIIAAAHISMKKNMLTLDEYLEIRDMFVPFNLPITIDNLNIDSVINDLKYDKKADNSFCFILLKKIGKAVIDHTVTEDEIREALKEIHFTEEDMME